MTYLLYAADARLMILAGSILIALWLSIARAADQECPPGWRYVFAGIAVVIAAVGLLLMFAFGGAPETMRQAMA